MARYRKTPSGDMVRTMTLGELKAAIAKIDSPDESLVVIDFDGWISSLSVKTNRRYKGNWGEVVVIEGKCL